MSPAFPQRRALMVLGLVAAAALAAVLWQPRAAKAPPRLRAETQTIIPGVHILAGLGPSAAYAIETLDGLVLVDSGLEPDAEPLKAQLSSLGLDWRRVIAILLTHAHGDHTGGAQHLQERTGARVYAGQGDAQVLREGNSRDAFFSTFPMPRHSPHPTRVDVELRGGERLTFGNVVIEAIALPGHTPGSVCYLLELPGRTILFTGDVVMQLEGKKTIGTYSAYLAPRFRGNARTFLDSLQRLRARPAPDLILPGHPFTDRTPQDPRVSPSRWLAMLDDGIEELQTLINRFREDGADFLDGTPRTLCPDLAYLGDRDGQAVYLWQVGGHLVLVNAPGGSGLGEFVQKAMTALTIGDRKPDTVLLTSLPHHLDEAMAEFPEVRVVTTASRPQSSGGAKLRFLSPSEFASETGITLQAIPLQGRQTDPVAYVASIAGKTVLFTPGIPSLFDIDSMARLEADLARDRGRVEEYLASISRLARLRPDLWLPLSPSEGQNANLYDDQWDEIISNNYRAGNHLLNQAR